MCVEVVVCYISVVFLRHSVHYCYYWRSFVIDCNAVQGTWEFWPLQCQDPWSQRVVDAHFSYQQPYWQEGSRYDYCFYCLLGGHFELESRLCMLRVLLSLRPVSVLLKYSFVVIMSSYLDRCHTCNFLVRVFSRDKIASVTRASFYCRATLFPHRALLYSVQLWWQNVERWLMQLHHATLLHTRATKLHEKIASVTSTLLFMWQQEQHFAWVVCNGFSLEIISAVPYSDRWIFWYHTKRQSLYIIAISLTIINQF